MDSGLPEERDQNGRNKYTTWLGFVGEYLKLTSLLRRINVADERRGFGPSTRRDKLPLWSRLVQLFYFYFTLKLLVSSALQHQYNALTRDLVLDQVERVGGGGKVSSLRTNESELLGQKLGANQTASKSQQEQHEFEQRAQLELTIAHLKLIGHAYYEFGAPMEPLYLLFVSICFMSYFQPLIYAAIRQGISLDLLRALTDPQRHRRLILAPEIERQASRYLGSSANYLIASLAAAAAAWPANELLGSNPIELVSSLTCSHSHPIWRQESLRGLELAYARDQQHVAELGARGYLVPPNRQPEWLGRIAQIFGGSTLLVSLSSTGLAAALLIILPRMRLTTVQLHNEPRDLLFQAELLFYCVLLCQCVIHDMIAAIMIAFDQIGFVVSLKRQVVSLTERIKLNQNAAHHTNRELIRLTILYELLKDQMKGTQTDMSFLTTNALALMLMTPLLARLYVAQMAREYRFIYLACSLHIITCCDFVLLPYCWLHARGLELLRARSRLLTSIDGQLATERRRRASILTLSSSSSSSSLTIWRASHDEHTVCLLRREQQAPELAMRNFALDAYFVRLTYANLLGVHFWCALLLAPLCMRDTARQPGASDSLLSLVF